jgi:glycosyltransferase involved in cell wall biosynthesis
MSRPTLALCIPAYRAEEHLPRLLATARQQDPPFDEIIICVDASPDHTAEVARSWGVRVLVNDQNLGCSGSKNRALEAATSDWVHFHDADDELLPDFTAEAHHWMVMKDAPQVVIMGYEYRDFQTKALMVTGLVDDTELAADPISFSIRNKLPNFGIYQRKALLQIGGFDCDPSVLYNEDVAFHIKLAIKGFRFRASSKVTSTNWRYGNSMSAANQVNCLKAHHSVMIQVAASVGEKYPGEIAARLWAAATGLAAHLEWQGADSALNSARRLYPAVPAGQNPRFATVCRVIGPKLAFRVREYAIRAFKPRLRQPSA